MKKRTGRKNVRKVDADLEDNVENYDPSDSDDGFNEDERNLLNNAIGRKVQKGEEEVLKVYSSSEDSDEYDDDDDEAGEGEEDKGASDESSDNELYGGGVGSDMDSDIEGKADSDGLPDSKAWGSDKKQYYNTDYVDKDYLGFDDEEAAFDEEKEADAIQRRLMSHLEGTDFTLGLLDMVEEKKKDAAKKRDKLEIEEGEEKVEVDLSKLSKDEFIELMKRKNPEMFPIIQQCKDWLKYLENKVAPVFELVDNDKIKRTKVIEFLEALHQIILHYAVNVLFYIHLKELGVRTTNHKVLKRLEGLNLLIKEMDVLRNRVDPEIDVILEKAANGEDLTGIGVEAPVEPEPKNRREKRKRKLDLLAKKEEYDKMVALKKQKLINAQKVSFEETLARKAKMAKKSVIYSEDESDSDEDPEEQEEAQKGKEEKPEDKRAVTFEMLKNKGLTPKRKKENRNPRVKHRNKFKKALVRRKGQYRQPRKELKKYGGETSGINPSVSKSIRIK